METITTLLAIWGAIISTILLYKKIKEDRVDIRVTVSKIVDGNPWSTDEAPTYFILVRNFGKRSGYIDSVRLKLQCGGKEYHFRSLNAFRDNLAGDISIPYELFPGRKLETSVDYWEIYKFVDDKHKLYKDGDPCNQDFDLDLKKLSLCKLIAYKEDQLGKIEHSKSIDI